MFKKMTSREKFELYREQRWFTDRLAEISVIHKEDWAAIAMVRGLFKRQARVAVRAFTIGVGDFKVYFRKSLLQAGLIVSQNKEGSNDYTNTDSISEGGLPDAETENGR